MLVVLRGWPGYQCPFCERQVHDLVESAPQLKKRGIQMLFVYPGPADQLKAHAQEFLQNKDWPADFLFVIDPDYTFTNSYGLRWDAPKETAYPSTFIIDRDRTVRFAHVSKEHGGRVGAKELLKRLDELQFLSRLRRKQGQPAQRAAVATDDFHRIRSTPAEMVDRGNDSWWRRDA